MCVILCVCREKVYGLLIRDSKLVIDDFVECFSSSDPGIVMSAAKVLPEVSILAAG